MTFNDVLKELSLVHIRMNGKGYSDLIKFDFPNRKIYNGAIVLYDNGIVEQTIRICDREFKLTKDMEIEVGPASVEELEQLYREFKYSRPEPYGRVRKGRKFVKENFLSVDLDDLTREQFETGEWRQPARIKLESYVMFHDFSEFFKNEKFHYWKSNNESLILYKNWVKGEIK